MLSRNASGSKGSSALGESTAAWRGGLDREGASGRLDVGSLAKSRDEVAII